MAEYWENLDLSYDPFDPNENVEPCFLSESESSLLDLLTQLSYHSHAVQLVLAPSGGGKTTLAKAFVKKLNSSGICQIQGDRSITIDFLRFLLAKHLGIHYNENQPDQFNKQLANQLELMADNKQRFFIVIDDAHALPERTLAGLLTLAYRQPNRFPPLHMVFFGRLPLESIVKDLIAQHQLDVEIHTSRINAFDLKSTKNYIAHCMKMAGYGDELPLSDNEIEKIHSEADGLPGLINQEAVDYLAKKVSLKNKKNINLVGLKFSIPVRKLVGVIGLVALISVVTVLLNSPARTPNLGQEQVAELALHESETATELEDTLASKRPTVLTSQAQTVAQNLEKPEPSLTQSNTADSLKLADSSQLKAEIPTHQPTDTVSSTKTQVIPPEKRAPEKSETNNDSDSKPVLARVDNFSQQEKYLMHRDPSHYTLQLMGSYESSPLHKFINRANLRQDAWYFHTIHNHKTWYVVVYGDYATRQDAMYAAKKLPSAVQQQKPWVRSFASVQSAITKKEQVA